MSEPVFKFKWGQEIRFIGGKYNGFNGQMRWCGETTAEITIRIDGTPYDVIEETRHLQDHAEWKASKSKTELALKPNV